MSFRSLAVGLSLFAGLGALSACGASPDESEGVALGVSESAIKGGYPDSDDTAVVGIVRLEGQLVGMCSGSLIAPNLVLTAQHCVSDILNGDQGVDCNLSKFTKPGVASQFYVTTKQTLSQNPGDYLGVSEVIVPGPTGVCGNDVALLVLNQSIPETEAVPLVPRVDTQSTKKDEYVAIGYGVTNDGAYDSGTRRRLDDLFINCVSDDCPTYFGGSSTEWIGDHGICEGDSGGPALDMQDRVIGVTSRGLPGCTSPVYGYVFSWGEWIKSQAMHAAEVGGYAPPAWATGFPTDPQYSAPVGDACSDPATCQAGVCLGDATGSYCSRPCADNAPCPEGYTCNDIQGQKYCQHPAPPPPATTKDDTDSQKSGCSVQGADPTKPVPWSTGVGIAAAGLALLRRRRRRTTVDR